MGARKSNHCGWDDMGKEEEQARKTGKRDGGIRRGSSRGDGKEKQVDLRRTWRGGHLLRKGGMADKWGNERGQAHPSNPPRTVPCSCHRTPFPSLCQCC